VAKVNLPVFGRPFIKQFALCYQTVVLSSCLVCLSVLSVCDIGVLWQTVGWNKIKLGMEVGLGPGHNVTWRPNAPQRPQPPIIGLYLLWTNGWMDQNATWYGGRHQPKRHCVRWGPSSPPKKGTEPTIFGPRVLWPRGCIDQDAMVSWRYASAQATLC